MSKESKLETIIAAIDHRRQAMIQHERNILAGIILRLSASYLGGCHAFDF